MLRFLAPGSLQGIGHQPDKYKRTKDRSRENEERMRGVRPGGRCNGFGLRTHCRTGGCAPSRAPPSHSNALRRSLRPGCDGPPRCWQFNKITRPRPCITGTVNVVQVYSFCRGTPPKVHVTRRRSTAHGPEPGARNSWPSRLFASGLGFTLTQLLSMNCWRC